MVAGEECREVAGGGEDEDVVGIKVLGLRFGKILSGERKERIKDNYRVNRERKS